MNETIELLKSHRSIRKFKDKIIYIVYDETPGKIEEILVCGGGRKNESLLMSLSKKIPKRVNIKQIDKYEIDGDFIESQAFAYLSIRSYLKKPISYPATTNVASLVTGGEIKINY